MRENNPNRPQKRQTMITHEEELVSGVAIINRVENSIVTHKGLEIEPVFWVALNPAVSRIS